MTTPRKVPAFLYSFLEEKEDFRATAYLDSAGVWTYGFGHTGPEVVRGAKVTLAKARTLLRTVDVPLAVERLYARVPDDILAELNEHQYAALISFVFNLGAKPGWTIWKVLRGRQFDRVPVEMQRFVYAADPKTGKMVKVRGLINRRAAEVALWHEDDETVSFVALSSAGTREVETPPVSVDAKPLAQSKSFMTSGLTALTATGTAAAVVSEQIRPFADVSPYVGKALVALATFGAVVAVLTLAFTWLKKRQGAQ